MRQETGSLLYLFQICFGVYTPNFDIKGLGEMHIMAEPVQDLSMAFPVLAICTSSGWDAPSIIASSAKVCTKEADKMPVAHRRSSFEARPDWPCGAFSKALLAGTLPDSNSSCHPLSLWPC